MRDTVRPIVGLIVLVGTSSLIGCETTNLQWALSRGYQQVVKNGTVYYCEPDGPQAF
jgi:hypothetical protein